MTSSSAITFRGWALLHIAGRCQQQRQHTGKQLGHPLILVYFILLACAQVARLSLDDTKQTGRTSCEEDHNHAGRTSSGTVLPQVSKCKQLPYAYRVHMLRIVA
jgi:hypothetical protein